MLKKLINIISRTGKKIFNNDLKYYRKYYPAESLENQNFFNIGAGDFSHPYWTNIDGGHDHFTSSNGKGHIKIVHEFFDHTPFPIDSNVAEIIYSSHAIEHIDDASVKYLLKECYRILKPGGLIRIVTPDVDMSYKAWRENNRQFFFWSEWETFNRDYRQHKMTIPMSEASLSQIFLDDIAASASTIAEEGADERITDSELEHIFSTMPLEQALDYCTQRCPVEIQKRYPDRHMNWFNEKKLRRFLQEAGFRQVTRSSAWQSQAEVLRNPDYFDRTLANISVFMEAVK